MTESYNHMEIQEWSSILKNPFDNLKGQFPDISANHEFIELQQWYSSRATALPQIEVSETPLAIKYEQSTNNDWIYTLDDNGNIQRISRKDGQFFNIEGRKFKKVLPDGKVLFEWSQPVSVTQETPRSITIFNKDLIAPVNGFLGVIQDSDNRLLMTVDQDATAETPNNGIIRLAIQASAGKIAKMEAGNPNADAQLTALLTIFPKKGSGIQDLLRSSEITLPIAPEDTNRDYKHNLVLVFPVVDSSSEQHSQLEAGGLRKWLTPKQIAMAGFARISNSHTMAAIKLVDDFTMLRRTFKKL